MATSPNFSWPEPDNTDLVKNGALAIRTAVNAIDSSLVDLKGGTTGQVLAKATNADMDFTWVTDAAGDITGVTAGTGISGGGTSGTVTVTNSMATAIDAKGDLIGGTGADAFARLPVGTNGQVLTADSAETTGLKWATASGGGKVLQVVNATYSTETSITSTSFTDSGLTLAITPTSASSKIYVMINQPVIFTRNTDQAGAGWQIVRNSTNIYTSDPEGLYVYVGTGANAAQNAQNASILYLDNPATTSSTTYKIQWRVASASNSGTVVLQRSSQVSSITLMEIGA
jgi:hypothetical protein